MDGTARSGLVMPILWAVAAVFSGPTSTLSCANTTLSDAVVAADTLSRPSFTSPYTVQGVA
jgi:hypothetical protein